MRSRTSRGKDRKCEGVVEAMLGDGKAESVGFIRGRLGVGLQNKYWGECREEGPRVIPKCDKCWGLITDWHILSKTFNFEVWLEDYLKRSRVSHAKEKAAVLLLRYDWYSFSESYLLRSENVEEGKR